METQHSTSTTQTDGEKARMQTGLFADEAQTREGDLTAQRMDHIEDGEPNSRIEAILEKARRSSVGQAIGRTVFRTQEFLSNRYIDKRKIAAAGGIGTVAIGVIRRIRQRSQEKPPALTKLKRLTDRIPFVHP